MRILITNDDGINAPGLKVLEGIAAELAGPEGTVTVVAPAFEQSGVGHCISYTRPLQMTKLGAHRFAVDGSPADCVLVGLYTVLDGVLPDLVLSGVNRGNNSAENVLYSGTIGAALEAALQGLPAIALSQYYGPANKDIEDPFDASGAHGAGVVRKILALPFAPETTGYTPFYNVNFPPVPASDVKGSKLVPQGLRPGSKFSSTASTSPTGRRILWIQGGAQHVAATSGSDADVNMEGYISVTPLRADLTDHSMIASHSDAFL